MADTFTKQSISHETAHKMVAAAVAKATELGIPQVVAVLDESGLLKAFCRMDGAALVSIEVAQISRTPLSLACPQLIFIISSKMTQPCWQGSRISRASPSLAVAYQFARAIESSGESALAAAQLSRMSPVHKRGWMCSRGRKRQPHQDK